MLCIAALLFKLQLFYNLLFHAQMRVREEERISMLNKKTIGAFVAAATLLSGFAFASLPPVALASTGGNTSGQTGHNDNDAIQFADKEFGLWAIHSSQEAHVIGPDDTKITYGQAKSFTGKLEFFYHRLGYTDVSKSVSNISDLQYFPNATGVELGEFNNVSDFSPLSHLTKLTILKISLYNGKKDLSSLPQMDSVKNFTLNASTYFPRVSNRISDLSFISKMPNLETLELEGDIAVKDFNFLSSLTKLKKIIVKNVSPELSDLTPLKNMRDLEELSIESTSKISDLSPLSELTGLKKLNLYNANISNISALKNLTNLTKLELDGNNINNISDIDAIKNFVNLQELSLVNNRVMVPDLSIFSKLTKLTDLSIRATDKVTSLDAISNLTSLKYLTMYGSKISDLSGLRKLTNLISLNITAMDKVTSLDAIKGLSGLKILKIGGSRISDFSPLSGLSKLGDLDIGVADGVDVSKLTTMSGLGSVSLEGGKISDLSPLNSISRLQRLYVKAADNVTDLSSISNLTHLMELHISGSNIYDISALKNFTSLYDLKLASPKLTDITPLRRGSDQSSIRYIDLQCCENISDYTPLESQYVDSLWVNKKAENNESIKKIKQHPNHPDVQAYKCYEFCNPGERPTPPAPAPGGNQNPDSGNKPDNDQKSGQTPEGNKNPDGNKNPEGDKNPDGNKKPEDNEKPTSMPADNKGAGQKPAPAVKHGDDSKKDSPKVPAAPKTVNDLNPEVKGGITVGNNNVAKAGAPNKVTVHSDNAKFNKELKEKGSAKAYAFMYSTPKLLRSVDGSDYVTVKLGADGVPYFDAQFPAGYSGKHTVVLVDEQGNQLAWTNITVVNNATGQGNGKGVLPVTGAAGVLVAFAALMFAASGAVLRKVRS